MAAAFVFVPPPTPSPRAQELARRLSETIDGFARENPGVRDVEVREALRLAARGRGREATAVVLGMVVALALAGALGYTLLERRQPGEPAVPALLFPVLVAVLLAVIVVVARRRH
jgi:hypothetical protein